MFAPDPWKKQKTKSSQENENMTRDSNNPYKHWWMSAKEQKESGPTESRKQEWEPLGEVVMENGRGPETHWKDLRYWNEKMLIIKQPALLCTKEEKPSF